MTRRSAAPPTSSERRARILFVHSRKASFVEIDRAILAERFEVEDLYQPGRLPPADVALRVARCDLVFGWFASWHTGPPITLAWLLGKPSVLVIGGFDTANMPEIGYGLQQGGFRRFASRFVMRRASRLVTNSRYSLQEITRNTPIPPERVTVIYHGVPDPYGTLPPTPREPLVVSVGYIDRTTLVQKGQQAFVETARLLPDVRFVLAGPWLDDAVEQLRANAPSNLEFTGWLEEPQLRELMARAAVYVQASRHEGFGMAVAEAMLAGAIPVVVDATAMPEVVGDAGVIVPDPQPETLAAGVRRALELPDSAREHARRRVLERFPLERRREALLALVASALYDR